jgi:aspartate/methionine/tyrosine aminotransferase
MGLKVAGRAAVAPFLCMDVLRAASEYAASGGDVLHLEIGQPSTGAPAGVRAAAQRALESDPLGYTETLGLPALRAAIARHYAEACRIAVDPARIIVTTGSSAGFLLAFLAAFEPGDRVAFTVPAYPAYRNILSALGLEPAPAATGAADGFQPTPDLLRGGGKLDGLIIASPANPTGAVLSSGALAELARACAIAGIRLVSDEVYHGITYGEAATTALTCAPDAIVVNSFSKYFAMPGWRIGWMVVPDDLVRPIERLAQNLFIAPPSLAQHAALAAFACRDELDANVRRYAENRRLLLTELPKIGITRFAPADGAFYLYADLGGIGEDSRKFCDRMLREIGVAATPGIDFDPERGNRSLRLSYAGSTRTIAEAARRLCDWHR